VDPLWRAPVRFRTAAPQQCCLGPVWVRLVWRGASSRLAVPLGRPLSLYPNGNDTLSPLSSGNSSVRQVAFLKSPAAFGQLYSHYSGEGDMCKTPERFCIGPSPEWRLELPWLLAMVSQGSDGSNFPPTPPKGVRCHGVSQFARLCKAERTSLG
jgi:hypothetical protein